jgi:hypothetical protein
MKRIIDFINEHLNDEAVETIDESTVNEGEVASEKDFRDAAKAKFEEVYGDDLNEEEMNDTIEGILKDNSELVEKGDWGALIGILNKSFAN